MIQERADPLWPVLLIASSVVFGTLWLESMARGSAMTTLRVIVPSTESAISLDDLEADPSQLTREVLEPINAEHQRLQKLARLGTQKEALEGFARLVVEHPDSASAHADYGYWLIRAGRFSEAQKELERANTLNPASALLKMNLGAALRKQGQTERAIDLYREALELCPGYIEAELALAQSLVFIDKGAEALTVLRGAAAQGDQESRARACLAMGRIELDQANPEAAHKSFNRAIEWLPGSAALRGSIARAWFNKKGLPGSIDHVLEAVRAALQLAPADARLLTLAGKSHEAKSNRHEAEMAYAEAVRADPHQIYARRRLLRFALAADNFELADRHSAALLAQDSSDPEFHFLAGLVAARSGSAESARAHYLGAIEASKGHYPQAYFNLGLLEKSVGHLEQAILMYGKAIEQDPKYHEAYNNLGVAEVSDKKPEAAKKSYKHALELNPKYASAWINLGELFSREGNSVEAVHCFEKAVLYRPEDSELALQFGNVLLSNQSAERAREVFRRIIERDPRSASAWAAQAQAELALGRVADALESADRSLSLSADHPNALRARADVARRLGELDDARTRYSALLERTPEDTSLRLLLAQVFFEQGQLGDCVEQVQKVLRFDGDSRQAEQWRSRCQSQ